MPLFETIPQREFIETGYDPTTEMDTSRARTFSEMDTSRGRTLSETSNDCSINNIIHSGSKMQESEKEKKSGWISF